MKIEQTQESGNVKKEEVLSKDLADLLVKQLAHEMYNHNLYLSFASYYISKGLEVLGEYYRRRAAEEKVHHDWIYNFLDEIGYVYPYPEIPKVDVSWKDLIEPFELTVQQEILTTSMIYELADVAKEDGDWITLQFLMDNDAKRGMLIKEQLEEEAISKTALDIAKMEGSWLRKQKAIMDAYEGDND